MKRPLQCVFSLLLAAPTVALAQPPAVNPFVASSEPSAGAPSENLAPSRDKPPATTALDRAFVTIPYAELRALWEAGQAAKAPPKAEAAPVSHIISSADYELQLGERSSALRAVYELEVLEAKWQPIPLIGGPEVRLDKAETAAGSIVADHGYQLLTNQAGKTTATLNLSVPGTASLAHGDALKLDLPAAAVKRLRISGIPAGMEARVNGRGSGQAVEGSTLVSLAGDAGLVTLEIMAPRPEQPTVPSRWQVQAQTLVRPAEARLELQSHLLLHTDEGSGLEAALLLPGNAASIAVTGEDLADWTQTRADDGRRALRLKWKTRDLLDREVIVTYATPQSPLAEEWKLSSPVAADQPEEAQFFAIVPAEGLELKGDAIRPAVGALRLPGWIRQVLGGTSAIVAEGGPQLALQAHWLATVEAVEATVSTAKGQLRLVSDGSTQTEISYLIAHDAPLAWQLELPAEVQILACMVEGKPARSVQRAGGAIELSLPAPGGRTKGTTVALTYAAKTERLDAVSGRVALELPRTKLFMDRLDWAVTLPGEFEVTAIEGNLSVAPAEGGPGATPALIQLRKDLCRGERPAIELYYQRRPSEK